MIAIVQRVSRASVVVEEKSVGAIDEGLLVLVAIEQGDGEQQVGWMTNKILGLRIFRDGPKHFDRDVTEIGGAVLLVSNFTVAAETRKGRRPSLDAAAPPDQAERIFARLVESFRATGVRTETGVFGGDMQVTGTNDGPATFIVRTERPVESTRV
jgi:D-tyrosyl-tRNA(Tyr) deacylase